MAEIPNRLNREPASLIYARPVRICFDCESEIVLGIFCLSCREHRLACDAPVLHRHNELSWWCHGAGPNGTDERRLELTPAARFRRFVGYESGGVVPGGPVVVAESCVVSMPRLLESAGDGPVGHTYQRFTVTVEELDEQRLRQLGETLRAALARAAA